MFYDFGNPTKMKSEWCRKQMRLLSQLECEEDKAVRRYGLASVLQEMAKRDYAAANSTTINLMEHLLYVLTAPNNNAKNHWLWEIVNFRKTLLRDLDISERNKKGNTNLKKRLKENWQANYEKAIAGVLKKARLSTPNIFMTSRIPPEPPWSLEDFLTKNAKELTGIDF